MQNKTKKILVCFIAAGALVGTTYMMLGTSSQESEKEQEAREEGWLALTKQQIQDAGIEITSASPGQLQTIIKAPAKIILNQDYVVHLTPMAAGIVRDTRKQVGDKVRQGEVLAVLESSEMAQTKSSYLDAQKKIALAMNNLEREKNLYDKKISAEQDYRNAVAEAEQARIELELARQKLQTLGLSLAEIEAVPEAKSAHLRRYELKSPISGLVIGKQLTRGEMIDTSREAYILANLDAVWGEISVFPSDIGHLKEGLTVSIGCPDGNSYESKVFSISPAIDENTRAVKVLVALDNNHGKWRPGMFVCADIKGEPKNVSIAIPLSAIQKINDQESVFIAKQDGFEVRPIQIGNRDNSHCEIVSGISPGENFAIKNTFLLKAEHGKYDAQHMD